MRNSHSPVANRMALSTALVCTDIQSLLRKDTTLVCQQQDGSRNNEILPKNLIWLIEAKRVLTCMVGSPSLLQSCLKRDPRGCTRSSSWRWQRWASWMDWQDRRQPICRSANSNHPINHQERISLFLPIMLRSKCLYLKLDGSFLPRSQSRQVDVLDDLLTQFKFHPIWSDSELEAHRLVCFCHLKFKLPQKQKSACT